MELFSKVYNCYYQVVGRILSRCVKEPITEKQMREICEEYGFGESALYIVPKLISGQWAFIEEAKGNCFLSKLGKLEKFPLTSLQKSWLKALLSDTRLRLFIEKDVFLQMEEALKDIEPLYKMEDFYYFDQYQGGDLYEDEIYIENFKTILKAIREHNCILISYENRKGGISFIECLPYEMLYSEKEDRFRVEAIKIEKQRMREGITLNLGKIKACQLLEDKIIEEIPIDKITKTRQAQEPVLIEISGERNSLERCMLHFASYKKKTEYDEQKKCYLCSIYYDKRDETELLIQILSFGPVIRVLGPEPFLAQIKGRIKKQYELFH